MADQNPNTDNPSLIAEEVVFAPAPGTGLKQPDAWIRDADGNLKPVEFRTHEALDGRYMRSAAYRQLEAVVPLTKEEQAIVEKKSQEVRMVMLDPTVRRIKAAELASFLIDRFNLDDLINRIIAERAKDAAEADAQ